MQAVEIIWPDEVTRPSCAKAKFVNETNHFTKLTLLSQEKCESEIAQIVCIAKCRYSSFTPNYTR